MEFTISDLTATLVAKCWQRIDWDGEMRQSTPGSWTVVTPCPGQTWKPRLVIVPPEAEALGCSFYVAFDRESGRLGATEICNYDGSELLTISCWPGLDGAMALLPVAMRLWDDFWPQLNKWEDAQEGRTDG